MNFTSYLQNTQWIRLGFSGQKREFFLSFQVEFFKEKDNFQKESRANLSMKERGCSCAISLW